MVQNYRHTQFGTLLFIIIGLAALGGVAAMLAAGAPLRMTVLFPLVMVFALALSGWMTVEVGQGALRWRMGIGLLGGSFNLSDIAEVAVVRNPWWYGLGVHLTPDGWLYNVSGSEAVRVRLASGRTVRLGSDEPQKLLNILRESAGV